MTAILIRWRYRFICWFYDRPDALARRVRVENRLLKHHQAGTSPTPAECRSMALELAIKDEVRP